MCGAPERARVFTVTHLLPENFFNKNLKNGLVSTENRAKFLLYPKTGDTSYLV
jgi:hypothetical protein